MLYIQIHEVNADCFIVMNDHRHPLYLVAAVVLSVDLEHHFYTVRRINDNAVEIYHWLQIARPYDRERDSVAKYLLSGKKRKVSATASADDAKTAPHPQNIWPVAQPYFPVPHRFLRQNAIIKWRSEEDPKQLLVGRILDFTHDDQGVWIQRTYSDGIRDDEKHAPFIVENWREWVAKVSSEFVTHSGFDYVGAEVLYWSDRPGSGTLCTGNIMAFNYSAPNAVSYGIVRPGGGIREVKWCHAEAIFGSTVEHCRSSTKYRARAHEALSGTESSSPIDVVVVGAGISGLTAFWALRNAKPNCKVHILEASNRTGGRLKSHKFLKKTVVTNDGRHIHCPQTNVELGAAFLSGTGKDNRFWNWLTKNGCHICSDWRGYNGGWWQKGSFVNTDTLSSDFVDTETIEYLKAICHDIKRLCASLLFPLNDIAVVDGLEYLKQRIPIEKLFPCVETQANDYALFEHIFVASALYSQCFSRNLNDI